MDDLIYFYPDGHRAHANPGHVERPERLEAIQSGLEKSGFASKYSFLPPVEPDLELLQQVHAKPYLHNLQTASERGMSLDSDTYTTPASYPLALNSAGGAIAVAQAVWNREALKGFALCRPPGHHATRNQGMGFCLLNNAALAARYLQTRQDAGRIAIIDLDLHHGNGTQDIFYETGDVFYISTHRYPFYPGSGRLEETGQGAGIGKTANFPLPPGAGDTAIRVIIKTLIFPLLERFEPDMLLVSAGFDTHWRDPLGDMLMTAAGYADAVKLLGNWADRNCSGRLALILEGGYDLEAVTVSAIACSRILVGEDYDDPLGAGPFPEQVGWRDMVLEAVDYWGLDGQESQK